MIAVGTLTPGPNNLVVLRQAAAGGWRGAAPAVVGILGGSLAVLAAVGGGAAALAGRPALVAAMRVAAGVLLAGLGLAALRGGRRPAREAANGRRGWPLLGGLFAFQLLNPKAWVLVTAAVASLGEAPSAAALVRLALLFLAISTASLALWGAAGAAAVDRVAGVWLDRVTGGLLLGFAAALVSGGLGG